MAECASKARHPTGKSPTCRGAPGNYQLIASGHPGKNANTKLQHLLPTDPPVMETSPFIGINAEARTRSAAIRTTMLTWLNSIKVDVNGEYHLDWLTLIFLAWLWQMTRTEGRIFAEVLPGTLIKYPYHTHKLGPALKQVVNRTFSADVAVRMIQHAEQQLKAMVKARAQRINIETLPFTGIKAAQALQAAPTGFRDYVRELIQEHSLEIAIAIGVLHGSPQAPALTPAALAVYSTEEREAYEAGRKSERRRLHALGRKALIAPDEAIIAAQCCQPTSHPINPSKMVQPIARALEHARASTPAREQQLAGAGSLNKKLTFLMGKALTVSINHGGIDTSTSDTRAKCAITSWFTHLTHIDPRLRVQYRTDKHCIPRSTALVVYALRRKRLSIVLLPTVFKTMKDFWKLMQVAKLRPISVSVDFPLPILWYDPDALIPAASAKGATIGIVVRAGKTLTWGTLHHCYAGGYATVVVALQVSRAVAAAKVDEVPLALQLLKWNEYDTNELMGDDSGDYRPVRCAAELTVPAVVQEIVNQKQCADDTVRTQQLQEHGMVRADTVGAGYISVQTIDALAKSINDDAAAKRKRRRPAEPLEWTNLIASSVGAVEALAELPAPKRKRPNLQRFVSQPRGTKPKGFFWCPERGRYIQKVRPAGAASGDD